jgi:serine phosphatase RsbU (regulator of sigma subunit)/PAS domain-containing protein
VLPPAALALVLANMTSPNDLRPGAVLVLLSTAVGLVRSRLAAAVCSVAGMAVVWWFNTPSDATGDGGGQAAGGLLVVALTLLGVQALLERVARSRRRQERAAATVDALVGRLPLGFGLVDRSKRFVRVNEALAALDGVPAPDHVGRRPGDVNPLTGELYEHLLDGVLAGGPAVVDHLVSFEVPETGLVHSWKIDVYPLTVEGRVVSAGISVADVTDETVTRRRAQLLLQLARTVAGAATAELVGAEVGRALADGLKARCVLLARTDDDLTVLGLHGYRDATATERWRAFGESPSSGGPAWASFGAGELVTAQIGAAAGAGAVEPEEQLHRMLGDVTVVWQPVSRPGEDQVCAAIGVFWPYPRPLTEHSRTLLATAASVAGLALARIELTERTERDRFRTAMDAMIDQVILAVSVRDRQGELVDFEIEFANAQALSATGRTSEETIGRRVSSLYPRWRSSGMFDRFRTVVETGAPWVADRLHYVDRTPEGREVRGFWNLQVVKVGDGYIAASRDVTEQVANERMAEHAREVAQRERIAVDLLQRAALPAHLPELAGVALAAHYQPARRQQPVGGDWYDAFPLGEHLLALVIADVAGDGPEAAGAMLQVRNILRAVAAEHEDPGRVLARVDEVLHRVSERDSPFATCCYVTLDTESGCVRWASAGHLPPVVRRAGGAAELLAQEPGPPLASLGGRPFPVASTWLRPGDQFLLYTDGLVERRGEVIDVGLRRLLRQVDAAPAAASVDLVRNLAASLDGPSDDTAILCATLQLPGPGDRPAES